MADLALFSHTNTIAYMSVHSKHYYLKKNYSCIRV